MERPTANSDGAYSAPHLTMHGSLEETTQANIIGIFIDNNLPNQGRLIFGNTSL